MSILKFSFHSSASMTPFKKLSHQTRVLPGRIQNRRLAFLFVTLRERIEEKVNISMHLCLLWRYASRFIQSKIPESCKSEVKPQIKVVIVQQSAALRARLTIFTSRDSQFRARPFSNRCGFAVYTTSKPYRFENAPLLKAYSKRPGSDNELGRLRVNERCNRIETDAVTNETASV